MANVAIVQAKTGAKVTVAKTATVTLDAAPTPGNLLLAIFEIQSVSGDAVPAPAGWTNEYQVAGGNPQYPGTFILSRIAQAGDTAGPYSFTMTGAGTNRVTRLSLVEITHQAAGTAWKGVFTTQIPTGMTGGTARHTGTFSTSVPALVLFMYLSMHGGTADLTPFAVTEPYWTTTLPYSVGLTGLESNAVAIKLEYVLLTPAAQPAGGTLTYSTGYTSTAVQGNSSLFAFLSIIGEDAVTSGTFVDQVAAETVLSADAEVRIDQIAAETVHSPNVEVQLDQLVNETVFSADAIVQVDSSAVEVVIPYVFLPGAHVSSVYLETVVAYPLAANNAGLNVSSQFFEVVVDHTLLAGSAGANVNMVYLEAVVPQGTVVVPTPEPSTNVLIPLVC